MSNEYTPTDRVCVNCKNLVRKWDPYAVIDMLIDGTMHYRCIEQIEQKINPVTGKVTVKTTTVPCLHRRKDYNDCGLSGKKWEPSEKFLKKKENLFKILVNTGNKK